MKSKNMDKRDKFSKKVREKESSIIMLGFWKLNITFKNDPYCHIISFIRGLGGSLEDDDAGGELEGGGGTSLKRGGRREKRGRGGG